MHEREYLGNEDVAAFSDFLRDVTIAGCPAFSVRTGAGSQRRQVGSLLEALEAYSWRGQSFVVVDAKIKAIRREMHAALEQCAAADGRADRRLAELELLFVSTKALSLGRVYEGAFPFLIHQAETGVLSENLRLAAALIDGETEAIDAFDDKPYRSDCAMTKVYAVMNRRTVVYDDRLGAALGLLCRMHLEREGRRTLPELLAFMVGDLGNPRRDPSRNGLSFCDKRSGREHARWNIRANWIISQVASDPVVTRVLGGQLRERIRGLEAALFMVGDDVRDQPQVPLRTQRRIAASAAQAPRRLRSVPKVSGES